jgi:prepilin-type N-terminal cleavage/methylation domain-containing protein
MAFLTSWYSRRPGSTRVWGFRNGKVHNNTLLSVLGTRKVSRMVRTPATRMWHRIQGFTLIELMIALGLLAILTTMALPQFEQLILDRRLKSTTDLFYSQILSTRTEAIKRGGTVIMCRTGDPLDLADGNDTPECVNDIYPSGASLPSKSWSYGWLAYATKDGFNGERNFTPGDDDVLLSVSDSVISDVNVTITSNNIGNSWLTYQGDGTLNENGLLHYAICDDRGVDSGYLITVFLDGEARIDELPTSAVTSCSPPDA